MNVDAKPEFIKLFKISKIVASVITLFIIYAWDQKAPFIISLVTIEKEDMHRWKVA